ncbi:putative LINE-1 retrotransposable element ORF2 protein [Penaeus vannamei]|uniref:Putative LINE-1 retrotransposable element ORF2 protein n=1 Tax=Penaeus vannamei TaxID=6689 RepID=A0A3R7PFM6_PENVA|nr:putative LINE-1 retrotransposable element ORF2 protein [Penaeus vannamei]
MAVRIFTPQGPIILSTAYIRPSTNLPLADFNRLFNYTNLSVFFAGDINARHQALHHRSTNSHGRQLLSIFDTKRLHYIGPDFTSYTNVGKGRPDLVFGNRAALAYHTHLQPGPNVVFEEHWAKVFYPHPPHPLFTQRIQDIDTWSHENRVETNPEPIIRMDRLDDTCELTAPISCSRLLTDRTRRTYHFPDNLLQALTHLYNASLASGYFPSCFKTALVALIPKPHKDLTDPKSYRPISLLETSGKTFERIINTRLRYLEDHNLSHTIFRSHHSTQDAQHHQTTYTTTTNRRLKTVLVTKDVERAFDTVWHAGLKYKLCTKFNFPPLIKILLCNFLDDRKLKLKFLHHVSGTIRMHAGVPQGSTLSPTLYIVHKRLTRPHTHRLTHYPLC